MKESMSFKKAINEAANEESYEYTNVHGEIREAPLCRARNLS
jgi:hypothetical protein